MREKERQSVRDCLVDCFCCKMKNLTWASLGKMGNLQALIPWESWFAEALFISCCFSSLLYFGHQFYSRRQVLPELFHTQVVTTLLLGASRILEEGSQWPSSVSHPLPEPEDVLLPATLSNRGPDIVCWTGSLNKETFHYGKKEKNWSGKAVDIGSLYCDLCAE